MSTALTISALGGQGAGNSSAGARLAARSRRDDPDAALVFAAKRGDSAAFEALVKRHERGVFRLAMNITRNTEDAEEVLQDTFLQALRHLNKFNGESKFSTWLTRVAINQSLMLLRKRSSKVESLDSTNDANGDFAPREFAEHGPTPEQRYAVREAGEILADTLSRLNPALRVVFHLRDVEELSTEETARRLGISGAAVKSRLLRARFWLRERLRHVFHPRFADSTELGRARLAAIPRDSFATGGAS